MVAQDGNVPEKGLGQETNSLRGRGQAKQVGGVDKQCRHSDKASLDAKLETDPTRGLNTDTGVCLDNVSSTSAGTCYRTRIRLFRDIITKGQSVLENQLAITTSVPGDNRYGEISSHMGIRLSQDQFAVRWLMEKKRAG